VLEYLDAKFIFQQIPQSSCKGKLLSLGGALVQISSALFSLPMFMISFFDIPRGVLI